MIKTLVVAVLACAACGKSASSGSSIDRKSFDALVGTIHHGDAWTTSQPAVDKLFGPAKIKTDKEWTWAVDDGDDCWELMLQKDGDKVGGSSSNHVNKVIEGPYARCAAHAKGEAK